LPFQFIAITPRSISDERLGFAGSWFCLFYGLKNGGSSDIVPYCQVFCQKKQENLRMLRLQAYLFVIPAWFWPESRDALDGVDSGQNHAGMTEQHTEILVAAIRVRV